MELADHVDSADPVAPLPDAVEDGEHSPLVVVTTLEAVLAVDGLNIMLDHVDGGLTRRLMDRTPVLTPPTPPKLNRELAPDAVLGDDPVPMYE